MLAKKREELRLLFFCLEKMDLEVFQIGTVVYSERTVHVVMYLVVMYMV